MAKTARRNRAAEVRVFLQANRRREGFVKSYRARCRRLIKTDLALCLRAFKAGKSSPRDIQAALNRNKKAWKKFQRELFFTVWRVFGDATWKSLQPFMKKAEEPEWVAPQSVFADQHLAAEGAARVQAISESTRASVVKTLRAGADAKLSQRAIESNVRALGAFSDSRIEKIVRTEVGIASNHGSHAAAKQTGLKLKKQWITVGDTRVRGNPRKSTGKSKRKKKKKAVIGSNHKKINGKKIPMEDLWEVPRGDGKPADQMEFPMDGSHGARADSLIHCRCVEGYQPIGV